MLGVSRRRRPLPRSRPTIGETKMRDRKSSPDENRRAKGVHFLDFCEPDGTPVHGARFLSRPERRRRRPSLAGRTIEIRGALKIYDGRPEIILSRISNIEGGAAMIPSPAEELRRRKPRPLQRRPPAPHQETHEGQSISRTLPRHTARTSRATAQTGVCEPRQIGA